MAPYGKIQKFKKLKIIMLSNYSMNRWVVFVLWMTVALYSSADEGVGLAKLGNGEFVTQKDLSDYLDRRVDLRPIARNAWGVEEVVNEMVTTRLLNIEGEKLKIPKNQTGAENRFDDIYGLAVYKKLTPVCELPTTEDQAKKFFNEHPEAFVLPVQAKIQRIILPIIAEINGYSAANWMAMQMKSVAQGGGGFLDVAKEAQIYYSIDPQGDLGWIILPDNNDIMLSLKRLNAGDYLGPIQEGEFLYLFHVVEKKEAKKIDWEQAKLFAATRALAYCQNQVKEQLSKELFGKYQVEINRSAIRNIFLLN